jgi:hypothetical protein
LKTSPTKTAFPITIAGKQFTLEYPIPAYWAFEDATGIDLLKPDERPKEEIMAEYLAKPVRQRMQDSLWLLWAGLITHHPNITIEEVRSMVFLKDMGRIEAAVGEAQRASMLDIEPPAPQDGEQEGEEEERPLDRQPVN